MLASWPPACIAWTGSSMRPLNRIRNPCQVVTLSRLWDSWIDRHIHMEKHVSIILGIYGVVAVEGDRYFLLVYGSSPPPPPSLSCMYDRSIGVARPAARRMLVAVSLPRQGSWKSIPGSEERTSFVHRNAVSPFRLDYCYRVYLLTGESTHAVRSVFPNGLSLGFTAYMLYS
ncbi:hypothetical protein F4861DRAFT_345404 [Xylaria intraflava]|nr:hypothetical protein F4861DRAFT_345404 [Xylaria intraflava]